MPIEEMEHAATYYREYRPCAALRDLVRTYFTFVPAKGDGAAKGNGAASGVDAAKGDGAANGGNVVAGGGAGPSREATREDVFAVGESFCSPLFADGHASIVFSFPRVCRSGGVWQSGGTGPRADVIGPMTMVGSNSLDERPEMVGVFLRAPAITRFLGVAASELTDEVVALEALWGPLARAVAANLGEINEEWARLRYLDSVLLGHVARSRFPRTDVDVTGLADWVWRQGGRMSAQHMADAAGTSRQHLTRLFHEAVGVSPKLYGRVARFHSTLRFMRSGDATPWAEVALDAGYADQSHMIREFRHFSKWDPLESTCRHASLSIL